jgi:hypothetical protein
MIVTFGDYLGASPSVQLTQNALASAPSWTNITGSNNETSDPISAVKPVFASVIESMKLDSPHTAYIGAEDGIWKTNDFTASQVQWEKMSGMPDVPVFKLVQQTTHLPYVSYHTYVGGIPSLSEYCATEAPGAIYAATYGKGIYAYFGDTIAKNADSVGLVDVERSVVSRKASLNIYPNPANIETNISYNILSDSKVMLKLFDMNGRLISSIDKGTQREGQHTLQMNCQGLKKGIYMVQIITNRSSSTAKLIIQ